MSGIPLNVDWQQILLHLFNFAILFCGLYLILYSPVKNFMEKRAKTYQDMDYQAKKDLDYARQTKTIYQDKMDSLSADIDNKKRMVLMELRGIRDKKIAKADAEAEKIIKKAHKEARLEKEKMLQEAGKEISDMVSLATEKLILNGSADFAFDQFLKAADKASSYDTSKKEYGAFENFLNLADRDERNNEYEQ